MTKWSAQARIGSFLGRRRGPFRLSLWTVREPESVAFQMRKTPATKAFVRHTAATTSLATTLFICNASTAARRWLAYRTGFRSIREATHSTL